MLDAPALTYWKMNQVAQAAIAGAERLIEDREAGKVDAAVKYLTTLSTTRDGPRLADPRRRSSRSSGGSRSTIDPRDEAAVAGARAWLNAQVREHGLRPLEVEAFLLHETLGYGGTCDLIAELDGEVWLLDWKTGSSVATPDGTVYRDHRLQLAAYANAEFIARVNDPERLPAARRSPATGSSTSPTAARGCTRRPSPPRDWIAFRACLALHGWSKEKAA